MAANAITLSLPFISSLSLQHHNPLFPPKPFVLCSARNSFPFCLHARRSSNVRVFATSANVVDEQMEVDERGEYMEEEQQKQERATEVYVCNLPRSCDTEQLLHMFQPYGTVLSVEVSRNLQTGESKGSAYVTLGSVNSAKNAIFALDGLDVGGREMRVKFSADMNPRRRNLETMNSSPKRILFYEGPHKLYVGNLAREARPEDLRQVFGRFGNVASIRILQDLGQGKRRVYAFITYLSERERDAAMSLNGTEFCGRTLVVREGVQRES